MPRWELMGLAGHLLLFCAICAVAFCVGWLLGKVFR